MPAVGRRIDGYQMNRSTPWNYRSRAIRSGERDTWRIRAGIPPAEVSAVSWILMAAIRFFARTIRFPELRPGGVTYVIMCRWACSRGALNMPLECTANYCSIR